MAAVDRISTNSDSAAYVGPMTIYFCISSRFLLSFFRILSYSTVKNARLFLRIKVGENSEDTKKP